MLRVLPTRLAITSALALLTVAYMPGAAAAATFSATSHVMPNEMLLDDTAKPLVLAVRNTGTVFIGAVELFRPNADWTIDGCTAGPAGWSMATTAGTCRYTSKPGQGDDIAPGATRFFAFQASTPGGTTNRTGSWSAMVSTTNGLDNVATLVQSDPDTKTMDTTAYSFELISALVLDESATPGSPCPSGGSEPAPGSANHILVVCGRNRTSQTLTPKPALARLVGNFIVEHGPFTSGPIAPTGNNVVLGSWTGVAITSNPDVAHTVAPRIGANISKTSAFTPFNGFAAQNQPPSLVTSAGAMSFTEGNPKTAIDPSITVSDPNDSFLERATVKIAGARHVGDQLALAPSPNLRVFFSTSTGVLVISGHDTVANYQQALRNVTFWTTNNDPGTSRLIVFKINDGQTTSNGAQKSVSLTPTNDAPAVTPTVAPLTYSENALEALDDAVTVADPDSTMLNRATLQVTSNYVDGEDLLGFVNSLGITSSWNGTTGTLTLSGTSSVANYQAALRSVSYSNSSDNPSGSKTVTLQVRDAANALSATKTRTINLIPTNDPPTILTSPETSSWIEGDEPITVDASIAVEDPDSANLKQATVSIGSGFVEGDTLDWAPVGSITGSYNDATGVLTLTGVDTVLHYQQELASVSFYSGNDDPGTSRTITYRVTDSGNLQSAPASKAIDVTPQNDAPQIDSTAPTTAAADELYTYDASAFDPDGPTQTWSRSAGDTCLGSIDGSTGVYTFTPSGPGGCTVGVQVDDGGTPNRSDIQNTFITIN